MFRDSIEIESVGKSFIASQVRNENDGTLAITILSASEDSLEVSGLITRVRSLASSPGKDWTGITTVVC